MKRPASAKTRTRHQNAISANNYLSEHGVQSLLTTMMQAVLMQEPENPTAFMINYLTEHEKSRPASAPARQSRPVEAWSDVPTEEDLEALRQGIRNAFDAAVDSGKMLELLQQAT